MPHVEKCLIFFTIPGQSTSIVDKEYDNTDKDSFKIEVKSNNTDFEFDYYVSAFEHSSA